MWKLLAPMLLSTSLLVAGTAGSLPVRASSVAHSVAMSYRLTKYDFVLPVRNSKVWLAPNMRRVNTNPPTFVLEKGPEFQYNGWMNVCAADFRYIYVKMSASPDIKQRTLRIFYRLADGQIMMELKRSVVIPLASDGNMHVYAYFIPRLHLKANSRFRDLRFDPANMTPGGRNRVVIAQIRLLSALNKRSACS